MKTKPDPMPLLFTVGHGRILKPADILRLVKQHDPDACPIVVDVRDSRVSRRNRAFDFSDRPVVDRDGKIVPGCAYSWCKDLGSPSRKHPWVPTPLGKQGLKLLAQTIRREGDTLYRGPLVLLCSETDPAKCHRRQIAEELVRRVPGLRIVHLDSKAEKPNDRREARDEWEATEEE